MASAYISINRSTPRIAAQTGSAIDQLQNVVDEFDRLKASFDQIALGSDWTSLAAQLSVTEAEAQAIYNLWGSAVTELHATFLTQLLGRCG